MFVRLLQAYPFLSLAQALTALRVATAIFFMAHAIMRVVNGTIPQFALRLTYEGWPFATAIVWAITVCEVVSGVALIVGRYIRWATAGLMLIAVMGIVIIHARLGWFVGEHGTGGMEYSLALIVSLITIAAADRDASPHAARQW
jgi:putative oxidoreductase